MKTHTIVAGVAVAVGLLIAPAVASANPPGTPPIGFVALGELDSDGKAIPAQVVRDSISSVTAGVSFGSNIYPQGAVVKISVDGDLDLPRSFSNCAYFVNGTIKGAWCAFEDTIQSGTAYELSPLMVTVLPQAKAELLDAVGFEWYGREYGADLGGIAGLAEREGAPGTKPVKGPGTLRLVKSKRLVPRVGPSFGFVNLTLVQGPPGKPPRTAKPSMTPTTRPAVTPATKPTTQPDTGSTTTPTDPAPTGADAPAAAPPAPPPTDLPSGSVGPLAFTGSQTAAVGGAGIFLIGAGLFVAVLMRRRGTKFVA